MPYQVQLIVPYSILQFVKYQLKIQKAMTSLKISSSSYTILDESFQTLRLLTRSQECSPIQELYSASSSNMSPQVLFPACHMQKKLGLEYCGMEREQATQQRDKQQFQSKFVRLLEGQVHESFSIDDNPCVFKHITESNLQQRQDVTQNKQNLNISPQNSHNSLIRINFTVSRHVQENLLVQSSRRCPLKDFEQKMKDLQNNVGRLKIIVDRFQRNPEKRGKTQDTKPCMQPQLISANILNQQLKKKTESTQSGNKVTTFQAKSVKSQNVENFTPIKQKPIVSEFQLVPPKSNADIYQMSPIFSLTQFSELKQRLNTSEISSRNLMKKKFNWKSNRNVSTV